jgi:hypothetical protein
MPYLPVAGVWSREWEEDPLGSKSIDRETLVLWTQSCDSGIYVDIRLPQGSPGRVSNVVNPRPAALAAVGLSDSAKRKLIPQHIDYLMKTKSFAGMISYSEGDTTQTNEALKYDETLNDLANNKKAAIGLCTCFWKREIDYQPPSGGLDIGVCAAEPRRHDGSVFLRETGDDGSYAEGWLRESETEHGPFMAMELLHENNMQNSRKGFWVRAGNAFAYAIGRPITPDAATSKDCIEPSAFISDHVGKTLNEAVNELATTDDAALDLLASYVAVTGIINSRGEWGIQYSTNPELVGCHLLGNSDDALCCSVLRCTQLEEEVEQSLLLPTDSQRVTRVWKVVELVGCALPV